MAPLRNQRHERFCLALAEGHSIAESYALAGYSKNTGNASRLNANESIQARVAELQAQAAAKTEITLETILADLVDAAAVAKSKGQGQALVSAAMAKAKLLGLDVQRIEIGGPGDFDNCETLPQMADKVLELLVEQFAPVDQADRQGLVALYEKHFAEVEQYLAGIRARPITGERVDLRRLDKRWQELPPYSPFKSQRRITNGNGSKQA
jgi:terminase small subunit-like protein